MFKIIKGIIFDWEGTLHERNKGLFSFTRKVLEELKPKYKLGMVSQAGEFIEKRKKDVENSGIKEYFESIIIVEKKTADAFKECINELKLNPKEVLIVGDRASKDIGPGNEIGCRTIWIKEGDRSFDKPNESTGEPNHKVNSIKEVLEVLK